MTMSNRTRLGLGLLGLGMICISFAMLMLDGKPMPLQSWPHVLSTLGNYCLGFSGVLFFMRGKTWQ